MSGSASIRSTSALLDLRAGLRAFSSDATAALREAELEFRRLSERLAEIEQALRMEVYRLEEEYGALKRAMHDAEGDARAQIGEALERTRRQLTETAARLERVRYRRAVVEERGQNFLMEQRRLIGMLERDVPRGAAFLERLHDHVRRYGAVSAGMGGFVFGPVSAPGGSIGGVPIGDADSVDSRVEAFQHEGSTFLGSTVPSRGVTWFDDYKQWSYRPLNAWMRTGDAVHGLSRLPVEEMAPRIAAMRAEFGRYALAEATLLYRGIPNAVASRDDFRHVAPGEILCDPAFLSTSLQEPTGRGFMNRTHGHLLRILAPRGVLYIPLTTRDDGLQEAELVLPPRTRLVVIGRQLDDPATPDRADTVIDVVALPPEGLRPTYTSDIEAFAEAAWMEYADEIRARPDRG